MSQEEREKPQKRKSKEADGVSSSIGCSSPILTDESKPRPERKDEQRDAKREHILPYVLPKWERQTVVLVRHPDHTVGPARSTSVKPISDVVPLLRQSITLFHAQWCACGAWVTVGECEQ
jgi:hypothetical protein